MAISERRISEFQSRGPEWMARWLQTAAVRYFCGGRDADAFRPFELFIGTAESTATDIRLAYDQLSVTGQADFRTGLVRTLSSLEARPGFAEIWRFLIELSWQLPESDVAVVLGARFNDFAFDSLCTDDPELFDHVFGYVLNIVAHTRDAARCISNFVRSPHYDVRFSRQTLLRLCEIDPDNWTRHFSLLRDSVYDFFADIRRNDSLESMTSAQNTLARDIFGVTGFDRFLEGLSDLYIVKDRPVGVPSDNWYYRSLLEREELILTRYNPVTDALVMSPHTNPSERRQLPQTPIYIYPPPSIDTAIYSIDPERTSTDSMRKLADHLLGPNYHTPLERAA